MDGELKTIRVLLLHDFADVAEQSLNLLRNSGVAARGQLVESFEDFESHLEKKAWDLVLLKDNLAEYPVDRVLSAIEHLVKDIPVIVLLDQYDVAKASEYLARGVKSSIAVGDEDYLVLIIKRELDNLHQRRERRTLSLALLESEKRCNQLIKASRDAVAYVAAGMHVYANERYLAFFGYESFEELEGVPILDLVASSQQNDMKVFLKQYTVGLGSESTISTLARMPDESEARISMHFSQATYDGELCTQLVIRLDDEDSDLQQQLAKISHQDILTGLYNRQYIMQALLETVLQCQSQEKNAAYLSVKIQRYNLMQNELGISNCDLVINDAASQMQKLIPQNALLGHFSDDSFAIILNGVDRAKVQVFVDKLNNFFETYLAEVQGRTVPVEFLIGVVLINDSSDNPQQIVMHANSAVEIASEKVSAGQNYFYYVRQDTSSKENVTDDSMTEQLQQAIESGMFKVLFQPIISLRAQNQPFYEVLLRMLSPDGTEVSPSKFIEEAASQKVAEKIDRWVVVQSIKALAREYQQGRPTRLIINLTPQTLLDESFVPWLSMALKASRLPHDALAFQLPEHEVYRNLKVSKTIFQALSDIHCKISVSRFGAMTNATNLFRHVHVDYVKLDGSYTKDLADDGEQVLQALVKQVHSMGKMTIATFVEDVKVLSSLYGLGVHYIQGFYLQPPSPNMDYEFRDDDEDEEEEISY